MKTREIYAGVAIIAALLVFVILGSFWQQAEAQKRYKKGYIEYGIPIRNEFMDEAAIKRRQQFIERARLIRNKWEPWARQHKELLVAMKKDQSKEMFERLLEELPQCKDTSISQEDLGGKFNPLDKDEFRFKVLFTWEPAGPDKRVAEVYRYHQKLFEGNKAFPLSRSLQGAGRSWIMVLTDGRIIETVSEENPDHSSGSVGIIDKTVDVDPPFDYLR
jgi:hypothetical protein